MMSDPSVDFDIISQVISTSS